MGRNGNKCVQNTIGEASKVWRNVAHPALQNRHRDLAWMIAHEFLPVRAIMHSRGMFKTSICPRPGCGAPETTRHTLSECSAVRDLWATAGPQQFPYLPAGGGGGPRLPDGHGWSEPRRKASTHAHQTVAHPQLHQRRHLDLQKPAGGEAHAGVPLRHHTDGKIKAGGVRRMSPFGCGDQSFTRKGAHGHVP